MYPYPLTIPAILWHFWSRMLNLMATSIKTWSTFQDYNMHFLKEEEMSCPMMYVVLGCRLSEITTKIAKYPLSKAKLGHIA